jgi:hypothetical protein
MLNLLDMEDCAHSKYAWQVRELQVTFSAELFSLYSELDHLSNCRQEKSRDDA